SPPSTRGPPSPTRVPLAVARKLDHAHEELVDLVHDAGEALEVHRPRDVGVCGESATVQAVANSCLRWRSRTSTSCRCRGPPAAAGGFLVVVEDPDAPSGTFLHYAAWDLPADLRQLPEGVDAPSEGRNGFGSVGWRGPCPPWGGEHHYVFRVIALERPLDADP